MAAVLNRFITSFHAGWGEPLYVYLAISEHAVSSVLLKEVDAEQRPIYFVSKTFTYCQTRAGAGIVLKSLEGAIFEQCLRLNFPVTNNEVEYEAFITGLWSASKLKIPELHIFSDSKLIVNQVTRKFVVRGAKMARYLAVAKNLLIEFKAMNIEQVGRDQNSHADALEGLTSIFEGEAGRTIAIELLSVPSLEAP
ncbi:uncharacterized protein LOC130751535 [Actinidia eriantha]|uniref:uncharacterized protein LOC130751535 n=1 Tax=Actinidia eriantha TaxID=165200 RepID=UPI00258A1B57|nr:uncharacterized protein LOC130751535 [Actinidia eriantha]